MVRVVDCQAGVLGSNPGGPRYFPLGITSDVEDELRNSSYSTRTSTSTSRYMSKYIRDRSLFKYQGGRLKRRGGQLISMWLVGGEGGGQPLTFASQQGGGGSCLYYSNKII